ncbi:hypothetical protein NMG60_11028055 [Bertholletia excelsa]
MLRAATLKFLPKSSPSLSPRLSHSRFGLWHLHSDLVGREGEDSFKIFRFKQALRENLDCWLDT